MGEGYLVQEARTQHVRLVHSEVVRVNGVRKGDRPFCSERAATEFIQTIVPRDVRSKTEPVLRAEVMIHAAIVSVLRVGYRITEGETTHGVRQAVIPIPGQTIRGGPLACDNTVRIRRQIIHVGAGCV